ncbi:hypothetical protein GGR50DRAFT_650548 [Xylaria sp. CBS 124048]|nr:hypothetical protein GGR50DRAFT_650548 [Xylaria sp. CBS 124048]
MQFTTAILATLLSATTISAAPVGASGPVSASPSASAAATPTWTFESVRRVCNEADTRCVWTFLINTGYDRASCALEITGAPASQASQSTPALCHYFSVTAGWSAQFGADAGFTTLAVKSNSDGSMAWPAYSDAEVAGGQVVTPDKSFAVTLA